MGPSDELVEDKPTKYVHSRVLEYDVSEWPPFPIAFAVAFQHVMFCLGTVVTVTYIVSDVVCISPNDPIRSQIFCSSLFMVGLATITQTLLGVRLPVFQGPSFTFLPPLLAMKSSGTWTCPLNNTENQPNIMNTTLNVLSYVDENTKYNRLNELQGSLILASLVEVLLGATGAVGILQGVIGPITIAVTIFLLGFSLYPVSILYSNSYWPIAIMSALIVIIAGVYLAHVKVKLPGCPWRSKSKTDTSPKAYHLFNIFAIPLSILLTWIICFVCTRMGLFPTDPTKSAYMARTDTRTELIESTPWFHWPYPGQFGAPKFNLGLFIAFISVSISSAMESIGDYLATGKTCDALPVPAHAVNRGILIEGLMSVLSAFFGTGHATTSYSVGASIVTLTKVGSRYAVLLSGVLALILAVFVKFGAVMSSMPDPIIGGIAMATTGIIIGLAISTLRTVDMTSSRNISVVGISIFIPIICSETLNRYPNMINTGNTELDKVVELVLSFPMILGTFIALVMDNTVKGDRHSRGLLPIINDGNFDVEQNAVQLCPASRHVSRSHLYDVPYLDKLCKDNVTLRRIPFIQNIGHTRKCEAV
ncbi:solute carrier family 23 member 2-like [Argopecten irradians]|uniref:solute carrier family 23 member 2-like n=1 Tax=Argopecten irradians TaxID=31199 RepID=UPI003717CC61